MATRSERARAEAQRKGPKRAAKKSADDTKATPKTLAAKAPKRTDKRNSRVKPDSTLNKHEEETKGSPDSRYRKSAARASRVRGH
jgi:hypothetical protein